MTRAHTHQSNAAWPQAAARGAQFETGQPGFAPIVDVDGELDFWRAHYDERTLSSILPHARFSDVEPAIRVGIHAFLLAPAAGFDTLAPRLSNTYRRVRGGSCLSWYLAEGPCAEAYARLQHAVLKPAVRAPVARPRAAAAERRAQGLLERGTAGQRPTARDSPTDDRTSLYATGARPTAGPLPADEPIPLEPPRAAPFASQRAPAAHASVAMGGARDAARVANETRGSRNRAAAESLAFERQLAPAPDASPGPGDDAPGPGEAHRPLVARL